MSASQVVTIFNRADSDFSYKNLLINNPDEALKGYDLTAQERETLSSLTQENYEATKGQWIPGG